MADDKTVAELTREYFIDNYKKMREQIHMAQPVKIGHRLRTQKESDELIARLHALPPPLRQTIMEMIAEKAGHKDNEDKPCELCQFLSEQISRKWRTTQTASSGNSSVEQSEMQGSP